MITTKKNTSLLQAAIEEAALERGLMTTDLI